MRFFMLLHPIETTKEKLEHQDTTCSAPEPGRRPLNSSKGLSLIALFLHLTLVAMHVFLLVIAQTRAEHNLIFSLGSEAWLSRITVAIATIFITVYCAVLVFVTQTLATRRTLRKNRTLTAIHDETSGWSGIGSALLCVWDQKTVPAAVIPALSAFFYLGGVSVLQISTPGLFTAEIFNSTSSTQVHTQGFPVLNFDRYNMSSLEDRLKSWADMITFGVGNMAMLPGVVENTNVGLNGRTLYSVPTTAGSGNATVDGTTIQVACGYLQPTNITYYPDQQMWNISVGNQVYWIPQEAPLDGKIHAIQQFISSADDGSSQDVVGSIIFYTNTTIFDSHNNRGRPVHLVGTSGFDTLMYLLQCSLSTLNHTAIIDAQSQQLLSLPRNTRKTRSDWEPASSTPQGPQNGSDPLWTPGLSIVDLWQIWYLLSMDISMSVHAYPDKFLALAMNSTNTQQIMLRDVEDALANVAAAMFWTLGNLPPMYGYDGGFTIELQLGQTEITKLATKIRLDLNVVGILAGLVASVSLALVSLQFMVLRNHDNDVQAHFSLEGTGFLHAIWIYRHKHQLRQNLEQVVHPTQQNLRRTGADTMFVRDVRHAAETPALSSCGTIQVDEELETTDSSFSSPLIAHHASKASRAGGGLSLCSTTLHIMLVAVYLFLSIAWYRRYEHVITFPLQYQTLVSRTITTISTAFGTTYSTLLVYVMQRLSMRRSLQTRQTLTVTHDETSAWNGIGSALFRIRDQQRIPSNFLGVLSIFLYLGNILVLHISLPGLLSVEIFNSTWSNLVETQSSPVLSFNQYDLRNYTDRIDAWDNIQSIAGETWGPLPYVLQSGTHLGLHEATLYDIPMSVTGPGNVTVNATGLDIRCGYLQPMNITLQQNEGPTQVANAYMKSGIFYQLESTNISQGLLHSTFSQLLLDSTSFDAGPDMILFTALDQDIVDSQGSRGFPIEWGLHGSIQLLRCWLNLVNSTAVIDSQSHQLLSVQPELVKTNSTWQPAISIPQGPQNLSDPLLSPNISLTDLWQEWYLAGMWVLRFNNIMQDPYLNEVVTKVSSSAASQIKLHDVENAMANVIASIFWTLGHPAADNPQHEVSVVLGKGQGLVTEFLSEIRPDLSIAAIMAGLVASLFLTIISLRFINFRADTASTGNDHEIDGMGFLQAIWLFRHHPELEITLEQVEDPTDDNLRRAGMVHIRLVGENPFEQ
ncbi:hypothetical protein C8R45DRAFT_1006019 [Mycena sanguinolenta]|nr:hypothetical protein C8R45DRAFT_1006019 [Mycena sanguinolenta]